MEEILKENKIVENVNAIEEAVVTADEVDKEVVENANGEPSKPKTVIGSVIDCKLLNVRREPNMTANILTRIEEGETVRILDEMNGFYKVQTNKGIIGFCMWNYISLNE